MIKIKAPTAEYGFVGASILFILHYSKDEAYDDKNYQKCKIVGGEL